ncbi:UNVERIFIED_ORG: hypothetical protein ABIC81_004142 [Bacillus proteolyticus]
MYFLTENSYDLVCYKQLLKREKIAYVSNLKSGDVLVGGAFISFQTPSKQAVKKVKNMLENSMHNAEFTERIRHSKRKKGIYMVTIHVEFDEQVSMTPMKLQNKLVAINELLEHVSLIHSRKVLLETYVFNMDDILRDASLLDKVVLVSESDFWWNQGSLAA